MSTPPPAPLPEDSVPDAPVGRPSARQRILATAADLFYREGIRAIGVDTIIARSGVAKMSLYRNFASKDALVVAFIEERNRIYFERWDAAEAAAGTDPRARILAIFDWIIRQVRRPSYRGCTFIIAATEFPDGDHPIHQAAALNKQEAARRLTALAEAMGARDPAGLADQLRLLMDGAYTNAGAFAHEGIAAAIRRAAEALIDAAVE